MRWRTTGTMTRGLRPACVEHGVSLDMNTHRPAVCQARKLTTRLIRNITRRHALWPSSPNALGHSFICVTCDLEWYAKSLSYAGISSIERASIRKPWNSTPADWLNAIKYYRDIISVCRFRFAYLITAALSRAPPVSARWFEYGGINISGLKIGEIKFFPAN